MHNVDFDPKVRGTLGIYMSKSNWLSIFNNLMTNSIKALAGVERQKKSVLVTVEKTSTTLRIEWDDNGSGISEEDLPNIFELLWTNRSNKFNLSLGLGLNIVQEIMEDLKGTIKIKETVDDNKKPGRGRTTFMLEMPLTSLTKDGT
jgi:signal transduction histidine kinase